LMIPESSGLPDPPRLQDLSHLRVPRLVVGAAGFQAGVEKGFDDRGVVGAGD